MAADLPTSAKRTNKGCFCRTKAFIRNNNAADRLTESWSAVEKQENERNVLVIPKSAVVFTSQPSSCGMIKMSWLRLWMMGAVKPVRQFYGSRTTLTSQYLAWDRYSTYVVQTPRVER